MTAASGPTPRPGVIGRGLLALIRAYQVARAGRPSPCRYDPSCSSYAAEAITAHGPLRGTVLAVRRVGRCHPWGGHGYDPVPPATTGGRR
jgi:putative membrane protein insertion efficiency factor